MLYSISLKKRIVRHIVLFLALSNAAYAQQSAKYSYSLGGEVFEGFILRHHEYLGHLILDRPTGFSFSLWKHTNGNKEWEANYNYPDIAFSISYYDLKNDAHLGKVITASTGMAFHLLGKAPIKNDLQFFIGLGLAYSTNPYDQATNNLNNVISTPITYNGNFRLSYWHQMGRLGLGTSLKLTHFSNGSLKQPNNGLNMVTANLEARYRLSGEESEYKEAVESKEINKGIRWGGMVHMGWAEAPPIGTGSRPVYNLSVMGQKRVSLKSQLDFGIEGFANTAIKQEIENGPPFDGEVPDYKRVGVFFGHELLVNNLTLVTQLGFYAYKPYYPKERVYMRIGLHYYINDHLYAGLTLKTHYAVAEVIEYGLGYRF